MGDDENSAAAVVRTTGRPLVSRPAVLRLVVGLLVAAAILVVVARVTDDAPGALDVLSDASWPWVAAAIGAQLVCYAFLGVQMDRLLVVRSDLAKLVPIRLALVVYGFGSVLPGAPAPGMVLASAELGRRGVGAGQSAIAFFLSIWFNVRTFLVLVALTAVTATVRGRVPNNSRALVIAGAAFVVAALFLMETIAKHPAWVDRVGTALERLNWRGSGVAVRERTQLWHADALAVVDNRRDGFFIASVTLGSRLADVICLRLALISVGIHVSLGIILIAYVVSALVSVIPVLPGGLGLVEATVPWLLHYYGIPLDAAVAGTIVWRAVTLLLPAIMGLLSYLTLRLERVTAAPRTGVESGLT